MDLGRLHLQRSAVQHYLSYEEVGVKFPEKKHYNTLMAPWLINVDTSQDMEVSVSRN